MILKRTHFDILAQSTTLYDLSVSCNLFSKAEMRQFGAAGTEGLICYFLRAGMGAVIISPSTSAQVTSGGHSIGYERMTSEKQNLLLCYSKSITSM